MFYLVSFHLEYICNQKIEPPNLHISISVLGTKLFCQILAIYLLTMLCLPSFCQFVGGSIARGSELQIEVAEFLWRNVQVNYILVRHITLVSLLYIFPDVSHLMLQLDGSLVVLAENIVGSTETNEVGEALLQYGWRYCYAQL